MRFIVIDGLDGAGKDTHAELIRQYYGEQGDAVLVRSHPTDDNRYGRRAKRALLGRGKRNHLKASYYYGRDVIRSIRRFYGRADTLIMVRYLLGVAYLPLPLARVLYKLFATFLPTSRYMFFLDVPPEVSLARVSTRPEQEMFETLEGLQETREKALRLVRGWHVVDTDRPVGDVHADMVGVLRRLDGK